VSKPAHAQVIEGRGRDLRLVSPTIVPTIALDAQCGLGPVHAKAVDGLEHAAPCLLQEIVAIENEGDRDTLAGGQNTEGVFVVHDHLHLFSYLGFCRAHKHCGVTSSAAAG
jgi:hypothetical protein